MSTFLSERFLRRALIVTALAGLILGLLAWAVGRGECGKLDLGAGNRARRHRPAHLHDPRPPGGPHGGRCHRVRLDVRRAALGENLAGVVVAVMYAGGNVLEDFAVARAERDLKSLIDRAPRIAHRRQGSSFADIPIEQVVDRRRHPGARRRGDPGRRDHHQPGRHDRRGGADGRTDPGDAPGGRIGAQRHGQRRRDIRNPRDGDGRRKHLCRHRAPGQCGADREGAVHPARGSLRAAAVSHHSRRRRRRLAAVGRSDSRTGRAGRGDPLPADPGRAGRFHRRRRPGGAAWHPHQGRRTVRGAGPHAHRDVRQDRNA